MFTLIKPTQTLFWYRDKSDLSEIRMGQVTKVNRQQKKKKKFCNNEHIPSDIA